MGKSNIASGQYAVTMGLQNTASGKYAEAMGLQNHASGDYAVAMGSNNHASGQYSVAMGQDCSASGSGAVAMGEGADTGAAPWGGTANFVYHNGINYFGLDADDGKFYASGASATVKAFIIPHPEHEGKMLRHACIEAPTRGTNIYEYQLEATEPNQTTKIALPSYFKHINGRPRVYVSAENVFSGCYGKVNENLTHAIIQTEKPGIFNVMVTGVRKDPGAVKYSATENIDEPIAPEDIPPSQTVILKGCNC